MNSGSKHITLIGAGPAGTLLSIYLARRDYRVTVYERRPDLRRTDIPAGRSINLALANRGMSALAEVGLGAPVNELLIEMRGRMLHDERGDQQLQLYGRKPHEFIYSISRQALTALLLNAAEATGRVQILFNHSCQRIDFARHLLSIRDESQGAVQPVEFERVIGCDGIHSPVRQALLEAASGRCVEEPLDHGYKELSIPPGTGGAFQMEPHALHIWPRGGYMLIALPNQDGGFTVTLFLPNEGLDSFATLTSAGAVRSFFERNFPDAVPLMAHLADEFFAHPTGGLSTIRTTPWHYGGAAVILGDAAHAIVPFHGQGMNCAFEDCSTLNACMERYGEDWAAVFAEFERLRKPNAEAIADLSLENYVEMRSTVRDPKFQLKKELAWRIEERHPHRFIPRYSMVMFHRLPYAEAKRRGAVQEEILEALTAGITDLDQIDYAYADRLVSERLTELAEP